MSAHVRAVETRRLYKFEQICLRPDRFPPRSVDFLQCLAAAVWRKHGRKGMRCPTVKLTDAVNYSYCLGYSEIFLTTRSDTAGGLRHDTVDVLLHELVHAMGYSRHGAGFVRKYIALLVEFGGLDEGELRLGMALFNIRQR